MLKVRIIPALLFKDDGLVKGIRFDSWRKIGTVMQAVKVYNMRQVDELIFLDVAAFQQARPPDFELVDEIADECFMPLTVGGGIKSVDEIKKLLQVGADKVCIGTSAVLNPDIISEAANLFGSQCIVVSIDVKKNTQGRYEVFSHSGAKPTGFAPVDFAKKIEALGAGEILLTSIDKEGAMKGYDTDLIKQVSKTVSIPVIAGGGAGTYEDMAAAIKEGGASAVSAASIFHFTQATPLEAKQYLKKQGINVRL